MTLPKKVTIRESGPREGFQFEGIGAPERISTAQKVRLIQALAETGVTEIQVASFVHPKQVPQMADAEAICAALTPCAGVSYTSAFLNEVGLKRALAVGKLKIRGQLVLATSETFVQRNVRRTLAEDKAMQEKMAATYRENGIPVEAGMIMTAFGCNYEGDVPLSRVLEFVQVLKDIATAVGGELHYLDFADTMGWANPEQIRRTIGEVRSRWPDLEIVLHLHDTRGLGVANVYAGLLEGASIFETAVGGLGGCPFAGHKGAAGNVCTEEVVFLCQEMGIETGVDLERLVACAALAEEIVGHPVGSKLLHTGTLSKARCSG